MRNFLTVLLIGLLMAGCSPAAQVNTNPPNVANPTPILQTPNQGNTTDPTSAPADGVNTASGLQTQNQANTTDPTAAPSEQRYVDLAKQDLAGRLKIDVSQISLLQVSDITGADLYSGCTLKGGQALMPSESANGYQISLEANGQDYLYHAGGNDQIVPCQNLIPNKKP